MSWSRRQWLAFCGACALSRSAKAQKPGSKDPLALGKPGSTKPLPPTLGSPVRFSWPFTPDLPRPFALDDMVAALVGSAVFPSLYRRAPDAVIEPHLAAGPPRVEDKPKGLRIELTRGIRPSDVAASISAAKAGGARLWLCEVPIPRVEGDRAVSFPGLTDPDLLARRLCSPLTGIARIDPTGQRPTGEFDYALDPQKTGQPRVLRLLRRPRSVFTLPQLEGLAPLARFELEGPIDLATGLLAFEREGPVLTRPRAADPRLAFLGDGLYERRLGARLMDFGTLAYLALHAGNDAGSLRDPGALAEAIDTIAHDRLEHLGFLRRDFTASGSEGRVAPAKLPVGAKMIVPADAPLLVAAASVLALHLGGAVEPLPRADYESALAAKSFGVALSLVRPLDDTVEGATVALATLSQLTTLPAEGVLPRNLAYEGQIVLGFELALLGAQARSVWIPRASSGGFDLEAAVELL